MIYIIKKNQLFQFLYGNLELRKEEGFTSTLKKFNPLKIIFNFEKQTRKTGQNR